MLQDRAQDIVADLLDIARYTSHVAAHTDQVNLQASITPLFERVHTGLPLVDPVDLAMYAHRRIADRLQEYADITYAWATITAEPCTDYQQAGVLLSQIGETLRVGEINVSLIDDRLSTLRRLLFS